MSRASTCLALAVITAGAGAGGYWAKHQDLGQPGEAAHVYKILSGRRSPSYPEDSDDLQRVMAALDRVRKGGGLIGRRLIQPAGPDKGFSHRDAKDMSAEE